MRAKGILFTLISLSFAWSEPALPCSCIEPKRTARQVRERMEHIWENRTHIVLVRTLSETHTEGWDSQRATLVVKRVWKGNYKVGDKIESNTDGIGGGMCDAPVPLGRSFFLSFDSVPVRINGCPSDFVLTPGEASELDRLRARAARKRSR